MNVEGWRERLDLAAGRGMPFDVVPGPAARVAQLVMPISVVQVAALRLPRLSLVSIWGPRCYGGLAREKIRERKGA